MPRGDGTGPMGRGSISGKGLGYCANYASSRFANCGAGFGRGRGMFCFAGIPVGQQISEETVLKNQENFLEKQLEMVKERLKRFHEDK